MKTFKNKNQEVLSFRDPNEKMLKEMHHMEGNIITDEWSEL